VMGAMQPPPASDAMPDPRGISDPASLPDNVSLLSGWWDDQPLGQTFDMGTYTFDEESIVRYAKAFDPQPFHTDAEAARRGPFGALVASGWHTASAGMRRLVLSRKPYFDEARKRGLPETAKGPSPGFRDLKWLQPVYCGDTLRYTMTPVDKRKTSREGWGIVFTKVEGWNQRGAKPFEYVSASLWPVRPA
jgi:acyl dehydratase